MIGVKNEDQENPIEISLPTLEKFVADYEESLAANAPANVTGKKAQAQASGAGSPSSLRVFGIRDAVRVFLSSEAAPVIRKILTNLDRDLFKLFTPTGPPVPPETTELPSTTPQEELKENSTARGVSANATTPVNKVKEVPTSTPHDEEPPRATPDINSSGSEEHTTTSIDSDVYAESTTSDSEIFRANKPKPNVPANEDDEDESYLQNKLNQIF